MVNYYSPQYYGKNDEVLVIIFSRYIVLKQANIFNSALHSRGLTCSESFQLHQETVTFFL